MSLSLYKLAQTKKFSSWENWYSRAWLGDALSEGVATKLTGCLWVKLFTKESKLEEIFRYAQDDGSLGLLF